MHNEVQQAEVINNVNQIPNLNDDHVMEQRHNMNDHIIGNIDADVEMPDTPPPRRTLHTPLVMHMRTLLRLSLFINLSVY